MTLPEAFIKRMNEEGLEDVVASLSFPPTLSVRYNQKKKHPDLEVGEGVEWCGEGYYLLGRPKFTFDPAIHQGRYYVQDASSMYINHVVKTLIDKESRPVLAVDYCAAPGGKTLAFSDVLPIDSLIVANEFDPRRAQVLNENLAKGGLEDIIVTQGDAVALANSLKDIDIAVCDVPCSGEGMMRKEEGAVKQWSSQLIDSCSVMQRRIVDSVWDSIRPGGYLIYSTCTFNRHENEDVIGFLLEKCDSIAVNIPICGVGITPGRDPQVPCYHFFPGRTRGEGFFIGVVKKAGGEFGKRKIGVSETTILKNDETESVFPKQWLPVLRKIEKGKGVKILRAGVPLWTYKGKTRIPTQELALLPHRKYSGEYPRYEVDRETALKYLSHESLTLPAEVERGYVLLEYEGEGLGFVKNLGNRANNLYPINWRIRQKWY